MFPCSLVTQYHAVNFVFAAAPDPSSYARIFTNYRRVCLYVYVPRDSGTPRCDRAGVMTVSVV